MDRAEETPIGICDGGLNTLVDLLAASIKIIAVNRFLFFPSQDQKNTVQRKVKEASTVRRRWQWEGGEGCRPLKIICARQISFISFCQRSPRPAFPRVSRLNGHSLPRGGAAPSLILLMSITANQSDCDIPPPLYTTSKGGGQFPATPAVARTDT